MFSHLVLGCLRDGTPRHGYEVCVELRSRTGLQVNPGNVYRELSKLSSQGLIEAMENPRDADVRRNPYAIVERGRRVFDAWLKAPATEVDDLASWLSFLDRVAAADLPALLERLQERLWLQSKTLARDREDAIAKARANGHAAYGDVASVRSLFQVKLVSAVLEFVEELQRSRVKPPALGDEAPRRPKR
jgi:DNA-binding PadR family transcriptional regulator